ncbi:MAG TPA: CBS domain-containing protein [Candidatus Eisenbacteria bacterium]|nr:CBS domain-containing protein [Candidatus Eisenbacteria bacterium]
MLSNKVSEIMTTHITTANVAENVRQAVEKMVAEDVGRIVIMDNAIPVGIFTEKDVLRRVVNRVDIDKTPIRQVMTAPVRAVREETHIIDALAKMYKGKFRHLLVRGRRGKIVGIVSMRRILGLAVELGHGMSDTRTLGSIMSSRVETVDESTTVYDAVGRMVEKGVGAVVVLAADRPAGIFTERDVLKRVAAQPVETRGVSVKQVMTAPLITMAGNDLVRDALAEMYRRDIRNMPVRGEGGELIGLVSMPDILQYASAFDIDEKVRQTWKEVEEYFDSEDQYTPG